MAEFGSLVKHALQDIYDGEEAEIWLSQSHARFNGRSARELLDRGELDPVLDEVRRLRAQLRD